MKLRISAEDRRSLLEDQAGRDARCLRAIVDALEGADDGEKSLRAKVDELFTKYKADPYYCGHDFVDDLGKFLRGEAS